MRRRQFRILWICLTVVLVVNGCGGKKISLQQKSAVQTPATDVEFTKITVGPMVEDGGESYGSGWGDYDNDGDLDLFVANGIYIIQRNFLYRNNGDGSFTKITTGSVVEDWGFSLNGTWGDYDNDGNLDLFVAKLRGQDNSLYKNNGDDSFTKITTGPVVEDGGWSVCSSWGDYDNDGNLDLFVTNNSFHDNFLYRNNGDGSFTKITTGPVVEDGGWSAGSSWCDYDNDGDLDLFVANGGDIGAGSKNNFLYRNNDDGSFTKITTGPIVEDVGESVGGSWGDYDNDGDLDLFVANRFDLTNVLYRNNSDGSFTKITTGPIIEDGGWSYGCSWGDYDNDGDLDLFVANGGDMGPQNNFLYRNNGDGGFTKITKGVIVEDRAWSAGSSWCDYDNDGDLDLFVCDANGNNSLYLNNGTTNKWVNIKLIGTESNSSGIGAKVKVTVAISGKSITQMREISGQTSGGWGGQNSLRAHFGLSDATVIDVIKIEWPSGIVQNVTNVPVNQLIIITEETRLTPKN